MIPSGHCKRAAYDAYEAAILYNLFEYHKFRDDYRRVNVSAVISNYSEIQVQIKRSRDFIRDNSQSKTRGDNYRDCRKHLKIIAQFVETLDANREELNKLIKQEWRQLFMFIFATIGAAGAIVAIVSLFIC